MADMLRTWRQAAPGLLAAAAITMVEASQRLQEVQRRSLRSHTDRVTWREALPESTKPMLLVANEFFDALPVRQFVRADDGWRERLVNWTPKRGFHDALGPVITAVEEPEGKLWEHSEEAQEWMARIAGRLAAAGGLALIIDYAAQPGETSLRGIRRHRKASPLEGIGAVDLSAGVDFALLSREAGSQGAQAFGPEGQGPYLRRLGIEARHKQLVGRADKHQRRELDAALSRLIDEDGMGQDFKVFAATGPDGPRPAAFPPPQEQTDVSDG
jgi:NADH dehydrogenase [ubiquinone] 1 alpha subcomplex assembly factor 7